MADLTSVALRHEELLDSLRGTHLEPGQLAFWWFGQLTYLLRFGEVTAMVDPYLQPSDRRGKPPLLTPAECDVVDVFLHTHDHSDHIDPWAVPRLAAETKGVFVAPRAHRQRMLDLGVPADRLVAINAFETVEVGGLTVEAIPAAHEFLSVTDNGLYPFLGYIIRGNGSSCYHAGDTVWWEGLQAELRARLPIDVAFVPINGRDAERYARNTIGNMGFAEAADLIGQLPIGLACPAHWDMFEGNREDPTKFTSYYEVKYPDQRYWVGAGGQRVIVHGGWHAER